MIHAYTENQVIQFIFREVDLFTRLEMEFAMEDDSTLLETYHELLEAKQSLPDVRFSPSAKSINRVLEYSRSL
ncbi:MAG: hypothetical protein IPK35_21125 [Saprospiraceae bacterium]|jgi:hypothetical protein|nr:hypothetical protein [Saprospiraceae bacterium]